ncbi:MAG: hypothetical protein KC731_25595, partial [Myxococcales bacterium]|nr:hypothetical protein [Myxococcales bacterium]
APTWLSMLRSAKQRIDIEQFYIADEPGRALSPVLAAIESASARGVKVRVLVDELFADKYPEPLARLAQHSTLRRWDVKKSLGGVQHAKIFVVDDREAYLGSANFDWRSLQHIHEIGVRIQVPALARAIRGQIDRDFGLAEGAAQTPAGEVWPWLAVGHDEVRLLASPRGSIADDGALDLDALVDAIDHAKLAIAIQLLAYDTRFRDGRPFTTLDDALRRAAARGVSVRLLVSHWQKRHPQAVQRLAALPGVEVRFITVPPAAEGFIPFARVAHAKYMTIDDEVGWVGTSNWEGDYFFHSRNLALIARGPDLAEALRRVFERAWGSPHVEDVAPTAVYEAPEISRTGP